TVSSPNTVVPRFCSANSPERCSVLGSIRSTLLGGLTLIVSAVNTIMLRDAATNMPTPNAHNSSVLRIRLSCNSCRVSDISQPGGVEGTRGCRTGGNPGRSVPRQHRQARLHRAARCASRTPMRLHRPHRRLRALNWQPRTGQTASTLASKCSFCMGVGSDMMADGHLEFNVVRPCHRDVRFGSKADIRTASRHVCFSPESGHVQCTRD